MLKELNWRIKFERPCMHAAIIIIIMLNLDAVISVKLTVDLSISSRSRVPADRDM